MRIQKGLLHCATLVSLLVSSTASSFTFDRNVPKSIRNQMKDDLAFVGTIASETQSDLHKEIFGSVTGDTYDRFFNSRVTEVGMNSCGDSKAVACVIPMFDPSKMWLTQNYVKFSHPQVARLMVVFHEARHTETRKGFWSHATCPDPFLDENGNPQKSIWTGSILAGEAACDNTPYGSYGSSLIMLKNISKYCINCTEKVKMDAGLYADNQLTRIIDKTAESRIRSDLYNRSIEEPKFF